MPAAEIDQTTTKPTANYTSPAATETARLDELQTQGVLPAEAADRVKAAAVSHELTAQEGRQFSNTYDLDQYWD